MTVPVYPRYQDSGVDWIGPIPAGWQTEPLKVAYSVVGGATPKSEVEDYWDGGVPWVTPGDLSKLTTPFIGATIRTISEEGLASCAASKVPTGSVILSTRAPIGSLGITTEPATTNQGCKALVPRRGANPGFLAYTLSVATKALNVRGKGTTFLELSGDELARFKVPSPSPADQSTIAAFLDRETGKIDALVEAQRRLIELLKEKRQAVISHAVTKGLDPNAPMKESGVEWLGEVPRHWKIVKLGQLAARARHSFVNGPFGSDLLANELQSAGVPVIYIRDLKSAGYTRVSEWCVSSEKAEQLAFCNVVPGDVLVAKVGDPPGLAVVYPKGEPAGIVTQDVIRLRPSSETSASFISHMLNSDAGRAAVADIAVDSTRTRIGLGDYKQLRVLLPPIAEQQAIEQKLAVELNILDRLGKAAKHAVVLLQERRAGMISAAVTGKIDVRGLLTTQAGQDSA